MEKKQKIKPLQRLMLFAKPHKRRFVTSVILAILGVTFGIVPYFMATNIIIQLMHGNDNISFYLIACLVSGGSFVLKAVLMGISTSESHKATFKVLSEVRRQIAKKLAKVPMGYIINTPSGKLKSGMVERIEQIEIPLAHIIPEMTSNLLVPIGIILYMFVLDYKLALASLFTIPIGLLCYIAMMKTYPKKYGDVVKAGNYMSATMVEYIRGIEVIKTFNQSNKSYKKFTDAVQSNTNLILEWQKDTQKYSAVMMSIWPAVLLSVLPVGCFLYMQDCLTATDFISIAILSLGISGPLISAIFLTDEFAKISTVMSEIGDILEQEELIRPNDTVILPDLNIKLEDVHFAYDKTEVLSGVDLNIPQGKITALVGASGSGKSTIAKLIASFWDITSGSISIGGVNIKEIPETQFSNLISYVSQDNYLFNDTVRNNIRMGKPEASDIEVEQITKKSGCHEFITELENGYDTIVGGAGGNLSGGERQRIAIARAMLKDSPIVILDEATSYTDPENEAVLQEAISELTKGKTLIVIAHRLSTIVNADQIVLVDKGTVVSRGIHKELLDKCSAYRNMWNLHIGVEEHWEVNND